MKQSAQTVQISPPLHHTRTWRAYMKRNWILYAMVLPGMAALMLFKYLPMYGILMAFEN